MVERSAECVRPDDESAAWADEAVARVGGAAQSTALSTGELSADEQVVLQAELWKLLARRTALYTMGESSSVPEITARRLLESVCFVLGIDLADPDPITVRSLFSRGLDEAFQAGMAAVEQKAKRVADLWERVALSTPLLESTALKDTLESVRGFADRYDYRYFAHEIPCDIDYPLAHSVPESMLGVDYVTEYLERLLRENDFMQRFELSRCKALLRAVHPEYRELIISLYEPIATNAIGLALAGGTIRELRVRDADRARISETVVGRSTRAVGELLGEAASAVCDELGIEDANARGYVTQTASDLRPRIMRFAQETAERSVDGLAGVFLSF